ncbi:hypothetical protein L7F22_059363 [Adiantum nelumboides]|nr:hypothetical protein [Adiantum nelumboides]
MSTSQQGAGTQEDAITLLREQMLAIQQSLSSLTSRLDHIESQATSGGQQTTSRLQQRTSTPPSSEASVEENVEPDPTAEVDNRELQLLYKIFNTAQKKKLDVKLPEPYNGRRDKRVLDQWLFKMEVYLSNTDLIESKKVALASSLLKDTAFLWWNRRVADGKHTPSWQKFRSAIRKAFEPANADFHARSSLRRLSQTGSLAAYITEFQRLTLEIETLSPSDKLHSFIDGLEPNLKDDVHKFDPATLDAAIAYVERLGDNRRQGMNFFPGERSFNNNRSFKRDNRGRYSQNQQRSSQNYQPARQFLQDNFLETSLRDNNLFGHASLDKRPLLKQDPLPTVLGIEDGLAKIGDVMIAEIFKGRLLLDNMLLLLQHHPPLSQVDQDYAPFAVVIIGDKGKQAVRAVRVSKVVSALMLNANTNVSVPVNLSNQVLSLLGFVGNHPLNVLVDSGCSTNFVSTMLVSKLRLPTQQSVEAFQVELADGSYLQCNKKVQQLEFQIQD